MPITLFEHQKIVLDKLRSGSVLVGGVGSGKSLTALAWYYIMVGQGKMYTQEGTGWSKMKNPKNVYVITTARKRDTLEWKKESQPFFLEKSGVEMIVDSWNNIHKYEFIRDAVFIFDEQRVVGTGAWVKSFLKITKNNLWLLLTATPGDTWVDYAPVFIANGFYKNFTEFRNRHVVYSRFSKYPKVERYIEIARLIRLRNQILVEMHFVKKTIAHEKVILCPFDRNDQQRIFEDRWNIFEDRPIRDAGEMCRCLRKLVNSDPRRIQEVVKLLEKHDKVIIFYNFDYEWILLLEMCVKLNIPFASWNGHKHEEIPQTERWIYMLQYAAGAEAWECTETNAMILYSRNYSYKQTSQSLGRIDRLNTTFSDLYYYHLSSHSYIDLAITKAYNLKRDFNESRYMHF